MHRNGLFVLLTAALLFSCNPGEKPESLTDLKSNTILPSELHAVWAGEDCELVQTDRFSLIFEREGDQVAATLIGFSGNRDSLDYDVRGIAILDTLAREVAIKAKDLLKGGELIADLDSSGLIELESRTCQLSKAGQSLYVTSGLDTIEALDLATKTLHVSTPTGKQHVLKMIEKFETSEPYQMPPADRGNVARCLQEWELGARVMKQNGDVAVGVPINTNRHSYVFYFGGMIYCRAARIRSDSLGTVFDQNIRMMWKPGEFTAAMDADNLGVSGSELVINDSLFSPDVCVYADDGIYWSLKSITDSLIVINGCGEDYFRRPSAPNDSTVVEWIAFEAYD